MIFSLVGGLQKGDKAILARKLNLGKADK